VNAAVQSHQVAPDLQRWRDVAAAAPPSPAPAAMAKYDSSSHESPMDEGSTSATSLVSPRYGYAVLGGVNPEASQKEAGAQQPKLHPTRDFRQGDLYQPQVSSRRLQQLHQHLVNSSTLQYLFRPCSSSSSSNSLLDAASAPLSQPAVLGQATACH